MGETMQGLVVPADVDVGVYTAELPPADTADWLLTMQRLIGGFIEPIYFPGGIAFWVDEDGNPKALPENPRVTGMIEDLGGILQGPIVGDVVILGHTGRGRDCSVSPDVRDGLVP